MNEEWNVVKKTVFDILHVILAGYHFPLESHSPTVSFRGRYLERRGVFRRAWACPRPGSLLTTFSLGNHRACPRGRGQAHAPTRTKYLPLKDHPSPHPRPLRDLHMLPLPNHLHHRRVGGNHRVGVGGAGMGGGGLAPTLVAHQHLILLELWHQFHRSWCHTKA